MDKSKYIINGHSLLGVHNIHEVPVINALKALIDDYPNFDGCSICIEDAYALALSRLPATYAHAGSIILNKELQQSDIDAVVRYSILQVIEHPKHRG